MATMTGSHEQRESYDLIGSDKVEGTNVYRSNGERIGEIERIMLEKRSGKVAYAVMSFGGFLGMGEKYHAVPWATLDYDTDKGGYVVPFTKEQLQAAPAYSINELTGADSEAARDASFQYYHVTPYWH